MLGWWSLVWRHRFLVADCLGKMRARVRRSRTRNGGTDCAQRADGGELRQIKEELLMLPLKVREELLAVETAVRSLSAAEPSF